MTAQKEATLTNVGMPAKRDNPIVKDNADMRPVFGRRAFLKFRCEGQYTIASVFHRSWKDGLRPHLQPLPPGSALRVKGIPD